MGDENGTHRAVLGVNNNGPALSLSDENGTGRAGLAAFNLSPVLVLRDENGNAIWAAP